MGRTPVVKTTTSLIERKKQQSSKHYYKLRISQAFPKLFHRTSLDPRRCGKKESQYGRKGIRSEWNQETALRDKYQIHNEGRDRHFYLSSRIYLYFLELCWGYVLQLFNYWLDCKEGIIFFFGVYMNNY